ncbi:MAG: glycogen synthase GlgA [Clostridia bacterium]|nr:glycogen synthase GlgA [Clostridia bacterium]
MKKKNILFAVSEALPFIKTGGLADVAGTLPYYFDKKKFDVRVILPKYACMKQELKEKLKYKFFTFVDLAWRNQYVGVFEAKINGITFYFIDNEYYFSSDAPYGEIRGDIEKFAYFCRAIFKVLPQLDFKPDLIHCHDWQSALIPVYLKDQFCKEDFYKDTKTLLTIHNLKFQGVYGSDIVEDVLGLSMNYFTEGKIENNGCVNLLKGGLYFADKISTVSETYAEEIRTHEFGEGLNSFVSYREQDLFGIVNGIDYDFFNPETDKAIFENYSLETVKEGKIKNKLALQRELGLFQDENVFTIGIVSRLTDQKGFDLIGAVLDEICQTNIQLIVLGSGENHFEQMFYDLKNRYPDKISITVGYNEELSHKIYAACDGFLMPSRFEPCGLSQLIALRYGTIPIVRKTGGLKDTVIAYSDDEKASNGFSFASYDAYSLIQQIYSAEKLFYENKESWNQLVLRAMKSDSSWNNSAKKYEKIYSQMLK